MDRITIQPVEEPVSGVVTVPGSKSITNRALLLAAMANGSSTITGALFSEDTSHMATCLRTLGIAVEEDAARRQFTVEGQGGQIPASQAELFVGNSGTTARFLTAFLSAGHGEYRLDGVARMRERPIEDLLDALRQLGVSAFAENGNGCPPVLIRTTGLHGGRVHMKADVSSQFLTGLLLVAPAAERRTVIEIEGEVASKPYVDISLRMMEQWGALAANRDYRRFEVEGGQTYRAGTYSVEPDASAASYFLAAAAVTGGRVRIPGLSRKSMQGDVAFANVLGAMGCEVTFGDDFIEVAGGPLRGVDVDMNGISDTVMTLAAIAPFACSTTNIRNVGHIRHKETDRLAALATELRRLGVTVEEREDGLQIESLQTLNPAEIRTYDDHRMAMSFAITGLRSPGITILDPLCVRKTLPDFFEILARLAGPPAPHA
jgi:3-phosphoshikimate 1-carboxyvinyltransferase